MATCKQCRQELLRGDRFCTSCGAPVQETVGDSEKAVRRIEEHPSPVLPGNSPRRNNTRAGKNAFNFRAILISLLAIILAAGGWWGWKSYGSPEALLQKQLDLAVKYVSDNNFEQAVLAYNEAIKIDAKEVKAYQGLAKVYSLQGKYEDAQVTYEKGLESVPDDKKTTLQLGLAGMYIDKGDLAKAQQGFQRIMNSNQISIEAYWGLAMVYHQQGKNSQAEAILRQAAEQNPNDYRANNHLALYLIQNHQIDDAFDEIVKSLTIESDQQEAYLLIDQLFKDNWGQMRTKVAAQGDKQIASILLFYSYYTSGDYLNALNIYQDGKQTTDYKVQILAAIAMQKSGSSTEAASLIKQLPETKLNDWLLSDLARYYLESGNKEKAREYAIKAVQANAVNLDAIALLQSINSEDSQVKLYTAEALLYNWKSAVQVKDEMRAMGQNTGIFGSLFAAANGSAAQPASGIQAQAETEPYDPNVKPAPHQVTKYKVYTGGVTARLANSQEMANLTPDEHLISGITTTLIPDKIQPSDFYDQVYGTTVVFVKGYMTDLAIDNHCKWNSWLFTVMEEPYFRGGLGSPKCSCSISEPGTYSICWLFLDQNKRVIGVDIYPGTIEVR